jgi:hypothetical protein
VFQFWGCASDQTGTTTAAGGVGGTGGTGTLTGLCPVELRYKPGRDRLRPSVSIAGEWNEFSPDADVMEGPNEAGEFTKTIELSPGYGRTSSSSTNRTGSSIPGRPTEIGGRGRELGGSRRGLRAPEARGDNDAGGGGDFMAEVRYIDGIAAARARSPP